jgi:hypothetical protein
MALPPEFQPPFDGIDSVIQKSIELYASKGPHIICGMPKSNGTLSIRFLTIEELDNELKGTMDLSGIRKLIGSYNPEFQVVMLGFASKLYSPVTMMQPRPQKTLEKGWLRRLMNERHLTD